MASTPCIAPQAQLRPMAQRPQASRWRHGVWLLLHKETGGAWHLGDLLGYPSVKPEPRSCRKWAPAMVTVISGFILRQPTSRVFSEKPDCLQNHRLGMFMDMCHVMGIRP